MPDGLCVFSASEALSPGGVQRREGRTPGGGERIVRSTCEVPANLFAEGELTVDVILRSVEEGGTHAHEHGAVSFVVVDRNGRNAVAGRLVGAWPGVVQPLLPWRTEDADG